MTRNEIRLECLKLAHRHDRDIAQVVEVAKGYEEYVAGEQGDSFEEKPTVSVKANPTVAPQKKKGGNADILS